MFASTGVTAAVISVAAGLLVGVAGVSKPAQQPVPVRVRVRRGLRGVRRR